MCQDKCIATFCGGPGLGLPGPEEEWRTNGQWALFLISQ
jgi:hypothetical protein